MFFYISGQFGDMQDFAIKNEEWKMALLRACYVSFQNASCYFVFLIVALRLKFVRDPIRTDTKRTTRIACVAVWCIVIIVNFLPIAASIPLASMDTIPMEEMKRVKTPLNICFIIVLHVGITLPLILTVIANISLSFSVNQLKRKSVMPSKKQNWGRLERLTNGLVVWLIICNAPYIAWYHWSLYLYMTKGVGWEGMGGVNAYKLASCC